LKCLNQVVVAAYSIGADPTLEALNEKAYLLKQAGSPAALPLEDAADLRLTGSHVDSDIGLGNSMR